MISKKSQSMLEYMLIIALSFLIIVPTVYFFFVYAQESSSELSDVRVNALARTMLDNVKTIYYYGANSKVVIKVDMPEDVSSLYIVKNRELVFNMSYIQGTNQLVFFSDINITSDSCSGDICTFPPEMYNSGIKQIRIRSVGGNTVQIGFVS